ncbi:MAG: cytochrome d ubiquinol oxidase subunit II [Pseudorhodobacter sp.]|nr:cytochrome d ubiquinol oxidase subunit II [Frankiaceae bacterium]
MHLYDLWFVLIAVLWTGYFVLEGFDFGVGMLIRVLGRDEAERRVVLNTVGPVWDGNEVWFIVAGGATFAAFPDWYATLFSGFYLPLLLILLALIARGVAFEYRGKGEGARWTHRWDAVLLVGSAVPALLWGVAFGNLVRGVPIDARGDYTGGFFGLLNPYALLGGLTTLTVFLLHGALFVSLKTHGPVHDRAQALAGRLFLVVLPVAGAFLLWAFLAHSSIATAVAVTVAVAALLASWSYVARGRDGRAFGFSALTVLACVGALVLALYPDVMPSSTNPAFTLTVANAASSPYTLGIMSWVALFGMPGVLAYQAWTFWVFRKRLGVGDIPAARPLVPSE